MIVNIGLLLGILWIKNTSDSLDVILFIFIRHNSLWRELVCEKRCKDASTRYYFYERIVIFHSGTEQNSTDQCDTVLNFIPPVDSR